MDNKSKNNAHLPECAALQHVRDKLRAQFERTVRKREAHPQDSAPHVLLSGRLHGYSSAIEMLSEAIRDLRMQARKQ